MKNLQVPSRRHSWLSAIGVALLALLPEIALGAAATHFQVTAPATAVSNSVTGNLLVVALDGTNTVDASYTGTVHFATTDAAGVLPPNATLVNGIGTFNFTLKTAGNQTITANDTVTTSITGTTGTIAVTPSAAVSLVVSAPGTATAGSAFNLTVTAKDTFGNTATGYTGTVKLTSTDSSAVLAANSTLTNGVGTFSTTLKTAGSQTVTATDTVTASITGTTGTVAVSPAAAATLTASTVGAATAGVAVNVTITAKDAFNNTATGYTGTVKFTSTDAQAVLAANSTLTNGVGIFSATWKTSGNQTVTATDTVTSSITGVTGNVTVSPAAAATFTVSAPATATAGVAANVTVTAKDAFGNTATAYAGTVKFTSTDTAAGVLPANSPLISGVGTFAVTLKTSGNQTVTATDTVTSSITGTSGTDTVSPANTTTYVVSAPATVTAGVAFNVTVTSKDAFTNTTPAYTGTVKITSTDTAAVLPANATLTNGVGTFSVTLKTAGNKNINATDTVTGSIVGLTPLAVNPAAAATFTVSAASSVTAGVALTVTVTAKDAFANTATGYTGTVKITSTDVAATLPANATLTSGVGTFTPTLKTAGTRTVTATDTVTSSITGVTGNVTVNPAAAATLVIVTPSTATAGSAFDVGITAKDAFNNTVTAYPGRVVLTSTDPQLSTQLGSTLTAGVGTFSVAVLTAGSQTITASDGTLTFTSSLITVSASQTSTFVLSTPTVVSPTTPFSLTVTAVDSYGNTTRGYAGTLKFTSTDSAATLPANSTLTSGGGGFTATLATPGTRRITVTDSLSSNLTGTSANITVSALPIVSATVQITNLSQVATGSARPVTVTTTPTGLTTQVTYAGSATVPSAPGTYAVAASVTSAGYTGSATATLTITAATQTVQFAAAAGLRVGVPFTLGATATSNLPVTFTLVSGNATLVGAVLTPGDTGPIVVRANQAGNTTFAAATANLTITDITPAAPPPPPPAVLGHFINLSARAKVGAGDRVFIAGFVVGGSSSKQMLLRAVGPGLAQFGLPGTLVNPSILVSLNSTTVAQNNDWDVAGAGADLATTATSVGAFALPRASLDAVVAPSLAPGAYTATVTSVGGDVGTALTEIYEVNSGGQPNAAHVLNFSARAVTGPGDGILALGFVISGDQPVTILVRGVGPTLAQFGVTGTLADPRLVLSTANGTIIASNDNWGTPANADIADATTRGGAFPLLANSKDAALLITVNPGAYSLQVIGTDANTGVALAEVYEVPPAPAQP